MTPLALANARLAAEKAWGQADAEIERGMRNGGIDYALVSEMHRAALILDALSKLLYAAWQVRGGQSYEEDECRCVLPEHSCPACRETPFVIYQEDLIT